jgi:hypothetical protein
MSARKSDEHREPIRLELDLVYQLRDARIAEISFGPRKLEASVVAPSGVAPAIIGGTPIAPGGLAPAIVASQ